MTVPFDAEVLNTLIIRGDQPTTCPICGNRTDFILDMSHSSNGVVLHQCLSEDCKYIFAEVEDIEIN